MLHKDFFAKFQALAYFTHKVTFPFFHCVEKVDQAQLLQILPCLCKDLCSCNMDKSKNYLVLQKHLNIQEPDTDLEKEMLNLICLDTADGVKLQCGREYGFSIVSSKVFPPT